MTTAGSGVAYILSAKVLNVAAVVDSLMRYNLVLVKGLITTHSSEGNLRAGRKK